jgi:polyisoprenoid-binding protein YceI
MHKRTITVALILAFGVPALASVFTSSSLKAELRTQPDTVRYTLDPSRSKFMAHTNRSGLLWFKGKGHHLKVGEFSGQIELTMPHIQPASLRLVVKAASLKETGTDFTEQEKQIINKELHDIVLNPDQYPEIVFQSTNVTAWTAKRSGFDVKLIGDLILHGVTRRIEIPANVTLNGDEIRATGKFSIDRDDFKVKATSAAHGLVRVSDKVKFEFDIVAKRL